MWRVHLTPPPPLPDPPGWPHHKANRALTSTIAVAADPIPPARRGVDWGHVDDTPRGDSRRVHEAVLRQHLGAPQTGHSTPCSMAVSQARDRETWTVRHALGLDEAEPPEAPLDHPTTKRLLHDLPFYRLKDGVLYRIEPRIPGPTLWRLFVPHNLRDMYLYAFHEQTGHPGLNRLCALMRRHVFWPGMDRDAKNHVASCVDCAFAKRGQPRHAAPSHPPAVPSGPFEVMFMDILTLPTSTPETGGMTKILVMIDALSRWIEVETYPSEPTSAQILDAFILHVLTRHGCPGTIRCDAGRNLGSQLCAELYRVCGIRLHTSTAMHHSSVAMVERVNSTLLQILRPTTHSDDDHSVREWPRHLPFAVYAYRATPNRVTQESPAFLLCGREIRPTTEVRSALSDAVNSRTLHRYTHDLCARLTHAWKLAQISTDTVQLTNKERADLRRPRTFSFQVGDRVLMHDPDTKQNKLAAKYHGPYRIQSLHPHDTYTLRDLRSRRVVSRVHVDRLKPYSLVEVRPLQDEEWLVEQLLDVRFNPQRDEEVLVKWVGFPVSEATWEPVQNLLERCSDEVAECRAAAQQRRARPPDSATPVSAQAKSRAASTPAEMPPARPSSPLQGVTASSPPHDTPPSPPVPCMLGPGEPVDAKFTRGAWHYLEKIVKRDGAVSARWFPYTRYPDALLQSPRLRELRLRHLDANPTLAPVIAAVIAGYGPAGPPRL